MAQEINLGPILQYPNEVPVIVWEQDDEALGTVLVMDEYLNEYYFTDNLVSERHEVEIQLEGFDSYDRYEYFILNENGEPIFGSSFFIPAIAECREFNFLLVGDTRRNGNRHNQVVSSWLPYIDSAAFYLNTGDIVTYGNQMDDWEDFLEVEDDTISQLYFFPTIGNHDHDERDNTLIPEIFVLPGNELFYSWRWGNIFFISLDGEINNEHTTLTQDQIDWLGLELASASSDSTIDHIIVAVHRGPFGATGSHYGSIRIRSLMDLFEQNRVNLIVSGHDHLYQHGVSNNGIDYLISAGGGAGRYSPSENTSSSHTVIYTESVHHFVYANVQGPVINFTAINTDGEIIDEFQLPHR